MNYQITFKTTAGKIGIIKVIAFRPAQAASYARTKLNSNGQANAKIIGVKEMHA